MMKKFPAVLLSLALALLCCTGCKSSEPTPDTVKWFNTSYALVTMGNKGSFDLIGGVKKGELNKQRILMALESSWGVTTRKDAEEQIEWLLNEGHRAQYAEVAAQLEEIGFFELTETEMEAELQQFDDPEEAAFYRLCWKANDRFGGNGIDAWDYCRALQLLGYYYVADLYTEQEVLDQSLEIAKKLQSTYGSWEDMMESYLYGYQYWQEDDVEDAESASHKRRQMYLDLKASKDNPYTLDWNTELVKSW